MDGRASPSRAGKPARLSRARRSVSPGLPCARCSGGSRLLGRAVKLLGLGLKSADRLDQTGEAGEIDVCVRFEIGAFAHAMGFQAAKLVDVSRSARPYGLNVSGTTSAAAARMTMSV